MRRWSVRLISLAAILSIFVLTRAALAQSYTYETLDDPNGIGSAYVISYGGGSLYVTPGGTYATGINNNGDIVGYYVTKKGPWCGPMGNSFMCTNSEWIIHSGFLYSHGDYTALDNPVSPDTDLNGINDSGDIVGLSDIVYDGSGVNSGGGCFLYNGCSYTALNGPNSAWAATATAIDNNASDINDSGVIVGYYHDSSGFHGFLYSAGSYTTLDDPDGVGQTYATGISGSGVIVGYYYDSSGGAHGYLYDGSTYTTLDNPNGLGKTYAKGINDSGVIVGYYSDSSGTHGFVYDGSTYTTIDDPNGVGQTYANGINNGGEIVGYYHDSSGNSHGFLATRNSLWQGATGLGGGWYYLPWFGYFYATPAISNAWIYHSTLGWLYPFGSSTDSVWFWDVDMSAFLWTSQSIYPFMYRASDQTWLYYAPGISSPQWFYNYKAAKWETD